jgi:hypothetical protein
LAADGESEASSGDTLEMSLDVGTDEERPWMMLRAEPPT